MPKRQSEDLAARKLEARQRAEREQRIKGAKAAWRKIPRNRQLAVVQEIVETRAAELQRAYRNVVAVTWGYGTTRKHGRAQAVNAPCVTFMVKKKDLRRKKRRQGDVPEVLLTYCTIDRKRTLCAVPTDVESSAGEAQQQRHQRVYATPPGGGGNITCVVRFPAGSGRAVEKRLYSLSCRHVFLRENAPVRRGSGRNTGADPLLGAVSHLQGVLRAGGAVSFDAALARLNTEFRQPNNVLRAAAPKRNSTAHADGLSAIQRAAQPYKICSYHAVKSATWLRLWPIGSLPLKYRYGLGIIHQSVIVVESLLTSGNTQGGDSGAPVYDAHGRRLLGMHIGGIGPRAFMIPAQELLRTDNYLNIPAAIGNKSFRITLAY